MSIILSTRLRGPKPLPKRHQRIRREQRNIFRLVESQVAPDVLAVAAGAETREALLEHRVLAQDGVEAEPVALAHRARQRVAKRMLSIVDQKVAVGQQKAMLAADGAPDERTVARIELFDAARRLDH